MSCEDEFVAAAGSGSINTVIKYLQKPCTHQMDYKNDAGETALMRAARNGFKEIVILLVNHGCNLDITDSEGRTALMLAVECGHEDMVALLIKHKSNLDVPNDSDGQTPFIVSCYLGLSLIAIDLIKAGCNYSLSDKWGKCGMHYLKEKHPSKFNAVEECISAIINNNKVKIKEDDEKATLLKWKQDKDGFVDAAKEGRIDVVREYLQKGLCIVDCKNSTGQIALIEAVKNGHKEVVDELINSKCDLDIQVDGNTAIMIAAINSHNDIVYSLASHNCNLDILYPDGESVLMKSSRNGYTGIVETLVTHKCQLDLQNKSGETAVMLAVSNNQKEIVQILISHYCNVECHYYQDGESMLMKAVRNGSKEIVEALLVTNKCELEMQNKKGEAAITIAVRYGFSDVANILVAHNCNLKILYKDETLLMLAASKGHKDVTNMLATRCGVNLKTKDGQTALMRAAYWGKKDCVQVLLSHGSTLDSDDNDGQTAFIHACSRGYIPTAISLIEAGCDYSIRNKLGKSGMEYVKEKYVSEFQFFQAAIDTSIKKKKFHGAVEDGRIDMVKEYLNKKGFHVDCRNNDEKTALILSCLKGHSAIAIALIEAGCDYNLRDKSGKCAIDYLKEQHPTEVDKIQRVINATICKNPEEMATLLKKKQQEEEDCVEEFVNAAENGLVDVIRDYVYKGKCCIDCKNRDGTRPLIVATYNGHMDIVALLIHHECNLDLQDDHGHTALICATTYSNNDIVGELVSHGCNLDIQGSLHMTALIHATYNGQKNLVHILVSNGCNLDLHNNHGFTALMFASQFGHEEIVDELIKGRCNLDLQNNNGETSFIISCIEGHSKISEKLIRSGCNYLIRDKEGKCGMDYLVEKHFNTSKAREIQVTNLALCYKYLLDHNTSHSSLGIYYLYRA